MEIGRFSHWRAPLALLGVLVLALSVHAQTVSQPPATAKKDNSKELQQAQKLVQQQSLLCVANNGQWDDPAVRFKLQHKGGGMDVRHNGFSIHVPDVAAIKDMIQNPNDDLQRLKRPTNKGDVLKLMQDRQQRIAAKKTTTVDVLFVGCAPTRPEGMNPAVATFSYYTMERHVPKVRSYQGWIWRGLYPGVDCEAKTDNGRVKMYYHVAPGADWRQIVLGVKGAAEPLEIRKDGSLLVKTPSGQIVDRAPVIYQELDGRRVKVEGRYRLIGEDAYGFEITSAYDKAIPLVIDPDILWSTYYTSPPGIQSEYLVDVVTDHLGNIYVTGYQASGIKVITSKFSPAGQLLWTNESHGSSAFDMPMAIDVDSAGNVYIVGYTQSADFPGNIAAATGSVSMYPAHHDPVAANSRHYDGFLIRLNPADGTIDWSTFIGGTEAGQPTINPYQDDQFHKFRIAPDVFQGRDDVIYDLEIVNVGAPNPAEYIYIVGLSQCDSTTWMQPNGSYGYLPGARWPFLADGPNPYWLTREPTLPLYRNGYDPLPPYLNYTYSTVANSVNLYYYWLECYNIANTNPGPTYYYDVYFEDAPCDGFVMELSTLGAVIWGTYLGGRDSDYATGISSSVTQLPNGQQRVNLHITGVTQSKDLLQEMLFYEPDPTFPEPRSVNYREFPLLNFGANGEWAPLPPGSYGPPIHLPNDAFVMTFDDTGFFHWASYLGGTSSEGAYNFSGFGGTGSLSFMVVPGYMSPAWYENVEPRAAPHAAVATNGDIFLAGTTMSPDFPVWNGWATQMDAGYVDPGGDPPVDPLFGAGMDAFVSKFDINGNYQWGTFLGGSYGEGAADMAIDSQGHVYIVGVTGSPDFPKVGGHDRELIWSEGFLTSFDTNGRYRWSSFHGGGDMDYIFGIAVDPSDNIIVVGETYSNDFAAVGPYAIRRPVGYGDGIITKFNNSFTNAVPCESIYGAWVETLYRDFLSRPSDSSGYGYYNKMLCYDIMQPEEVVRNFIASPEFSDTYGFVARCYFTLFNNNFTSSWMFNDGYRLPDYGGMNFWQQHMLAYGPARLTDAKLSVITHFTQSEEWEMRVGAITDQEFVEFLYNNILGRASDPEGHASHLANLQAGRVTRQQLILEFIESPEAVAKYSNHTYVTMCYQGFLQRSVELNGFRFHMYRLEFGVQNVVSVLVNFIYSPEYLARITQSGVDVTRF